MAASAILPEIARWSRPDGSRLVLRADGVVSVRRAGERDYHEWPRRWTVAAANAAAEKLGYKLHSAGREGGDAVKPDLPQRPAKTRKSREWLEPAGVVFEEIIGFFKPALALKESDPAEYERRIEQYARRAAENQPLFGPLPPPAPPAVKPPPQESVPAKRKYRTRRDPDQPTMRTCRKCKERRLLFPRRGGRCDDCYAAATGATPWNLRTTEAKEAAGA